MYGALFSELGRPKADYQGVVLGGECPLGPADRRLTNRVGVCVRVCVGVHVVLIIFNGIQRDSMGCNGIQWDATGFNKIQWDSTGFDGIQRDSTGFHGIPRDPTGFHGIP